MADREREKHRERTFEEGALYQEARRIGFADAETVVRRLATTLRPSATPRPLLTGDPELVAFDGDGVTIVDLRA